MYKKILNFIHMRNVNENYIATIFSQTIFQNKVWKQWPAKDLGPL